MRILIICKLHCGSGAIPVSAPFLSVFVLQTLTLFEIRND